MSNAPDGGHGGGVRVPVWFWHGVILTVLGASVGWIAYNAGDDLKEARRVNDSQALTLTNHEARLGSLERGQEKVADKLETILSRLPPAK